jgi:hypothetical protein
MPVLTTCSSCRRQLQVPEELLGRLVKCPACGNTFSASASAAPGPAPATAAPPPSLPPLEAPAPPSRPSADRAPAEDFEEVRPPRRRNEGDAYQEGPPRRRSADDEWDDAERLPRRRRAAGDAYEDDYEPPIRRGLGLQGLSSDYAIDIGTWFNFAKEHYSAVLGPMIGFMMIQVLIGLVEMIPIVGVLIQLAMLFINPALNAGYAIVALAQLKGKRWSFGDFFSGFNWYGALLGNFWLTIAMMLVCLLPALITLGIVAALASATRTPELFWVAGIVAFVNSVLAIYVVVRATSFSVQLIVDRDCGAVESIKGSWELTSGHFWGLFGIALLLGLMVLGGLLACGIGALFVMPLVVLTWNAGYLIITGNEPPRRSISRDEEEYYDDQAERR